MHHFLKKFARFTHYILLIFHVFRVSENTNSASRALSDWPNCRVPPDQEILDG
jgi:hypothetical protein